MRLPVASQAVAFQAARAAPLLASPSLVSSLCALKDDNQGRALASFGGSCSWKKIGLIRACFEGGQCWLFSVASPTPPHPPPSSRAHADTTDAFGQGLADSFLASATAQNISVSNVVAMPQVGPCTWTR